MVKKFDRWSLFFDFLRQNNTWDGIAIVEKRCILILQNGKYHSYNSPAVIFGHKYEFYLRGNLYSPGKIFPLLETELQKKLLFRFDDFLNKTLSVSFYDKNLFEIACNNLRPDV